MIFFNTFKPHFSFLQIKRLTDHVQLTCHCYKTEDMTLQKRIPSF